jgi:hypothetical protein
LGGIGSHDVNKILGRGQTFLKGASDRIKLRRAIVKVASEKARQIAALKEWEERRNGK